MLLNSKHLNLPLMFHPKQTVPAPTVQLAPHRCHSKLISFLSDSQECHMSNSLAKAETP